MYTISNILSLVSNNPEACSSTVNLQNKQINKSMAAAAQNVFVLQQAICVSGYDAQCNDGTLHRSDPTHAADDGDDVWAGASEDDQSRPQYDLPMIIITSSTLASIRAATVSPLSMYTWLERLECMINISGFGTLG